MGHIADGNREKVLRLSHNTADEKRAAVRAVCLLAEGDAEAARSVLAALGLTDTAEQMHHERNRK